MHISKGEVLSSAEKTVKRTSSALQILYSGDGVDAEICRVLTKYEGRLPVNNMLISKRFISIDLGALLPLPRRP